VLDMLGLDTAAKQLPTLAPAGPLTDPTTVELWADPDEADDRLRHLVRQARKEIASYHPCPASVRHEQRYQLAETAAARRIAVRGVFLDGIDDDPAVAAHTRRLVEHGAQLRTSPSVPARMTLIDRHTAVLAAGADSEGVVVVRGHGVPLILAEHFDRTWATAAPLGGPTAGHDRYQPNPTERTALSLLAQGLTDEAVARRLDVSLRTVRRMMARLMVLLGSRSRFEAGVRATKRGWI
jgi:DNA-binding CsgD family transcriptional regulator